jgi:hypothetical protein
MLDMKYSVSLFNFEVALPLTIFLFLLQDEICKSIAESGGIDAILKCIDDSGEQGNKIVAKTCCSLLSKVQGKSGSEFMFFSCLDEQGAYCILFD